MFSKTERDGFTLVELLVVIGIIALLIAILMPALSRARKQALAVSCGSNERQVTYAAIAYSNDWKEQLPTRIAYYTPEVPPCWVNYTGVAWYVRLPVIGWDTWTVLSVRDYAFRCDKGLGGWAYVIRDYLKNDYDVFHCPDGFFSKTGYRRLLDKVDGPPGSMWDFDIGFPTYFWLPHRTKNAAVEWCACGGTGGSDADCISDRPKDICKTASDKPELLVMTDFVQYGMYGYDGSTWIGRPSVEDSWIRANHSANPTKDVGYWEGEVGTYYNPCLPAGVDPDNLPLGSNASRIDCRVTWTPFQNLRTRYACPYGAANCASEAGEYGSHMW